MVVTDLFLHSDGSRVKIFSSKEDSPYFMIVPNSSLPEHETRVKHHSYSFQHV